MRLSLCLLEEDYLDWLENAHRSPAEMIAADALLLAACVTLGTAVIASLWLMQR